MRSSQLRLTPSRFSGLDLVEVYYNGKWGSVCPFYYLSSPYTVRIGVLRRIGRVVCRQLGYSNLTRATNADILQRNTAVANANQSVWLVINSCKGTESDIDSCSLQWGISPCPDIYDVLVNCSACKYTRHVVRTPLLRNQFCFF